MLQEKDYKNPYFLINLLSTLGLALLAIYSNADIGKLSFVMPLVYFALVAFLFVNKLKHFTFMAINLVTYGLCVLFLLLPPKGTVADYVIWWAPLILGFAFTWITKSTSDSTQ